MDGSAHWLIHFWKNLASTCRIKMTDPSVISSKLVERAIFKQTDRHMVQHHIYPVLQSSYCAGHSTETALLKVMNDIMHSVNSQCVALFVLLDLSVAFDTVNHEILVNRMQKKVGLQGTVLNWFKVSGYLSVEHFLDASTLIAGSLKSLG